MKVGSLPGQSKAISSEWVLNLLAGMKFPGQGQAYDFIKKAIDEDC